jgi:hypothetical protein
MKDTVVYQDRHDWSFHPTSLYRLGHYFLTFAYHTAYIIKKYKGRIEFRC